VRCDDDLIILEFGNQPFELGHLTPPCKTRLKPPTVS
jgi:hypothetical protein